MAEKFPLLAVRPAAERQDSRLLTAFKRRPPRTAAKIRLFGGCMFSVGSSVHVYNAWRIGLTEFFPKVESQRQLEKALPRGSTLDVWYDPAAADVMTQGMYLRLYTARLSAAAIVSDGHQADARVECGHSCRPSVIPRAAKAQG